jgi:hypothetical protein
MKFVLRMVAAIAFALAGTATAQMPAAVPLDRWDLRQTPESCYLTRSFTNGPEQVELRIESFGPTSPYHFVLIGSGLPIGKQSSMLARVGFGGEGAAKNIVVLAGPSGRLPAIVMMAALSRPTAVLGWFYSYTKNAGDWLAQVDPSAEELFIDFPDMLPLTLPLGPMSDEYSRLDGCAKAMADKWSAAISGTNPPATGPRLQEPHWLNTRVKYPDNLLLNRVNGLVELRMRVDPDGRARDCVVQKAIWAAQFGEDSCRAMEEWARFEPARDSSGDPVSASFRVAAPYIIFNW